jgi:hypothetical protein
MRNPFLIQLSHGDLQYLILLRNFNIVQIDGQATLDSLIDITEEFIECLALGGTAWNRRNFGPVTTFFRLVNDYF